MKFDNTKSWKEQELPIKCSKWFPICGSHVKNVIFDVYFEDYGVSSKVYIHRQNAFKMLCMSGSPQFYSISGVQFEDGTETYAKWYQDRISNCFKIVTIGGTILGLQGGYNQRIPENCYLDNGEWKLTSQLPEGAIYHYCLI